MLSQIYRFHGHGSLRYVYKNGKSIRSRLFTIRFTRNHRRKVPRFSVVVSKKVAKSAVVRNRIRRRVYEIFRTHLPNITEVYDIVCIITTPEVATMQHQELTQAVADQLQQAGILPSSDERNSAII